MNFPENYCVWCDAGFTPGHGGKAQRFCSTQCRNAYFAACRAWGEQEHQEGRVPTATLRNAHKQRARSPSPPVAQTIEDEASEGILTPENGSV